MSIDLFHLLTHTMKLNTQAFSGQVIIITGAGQGIGYHTAHAFALLCGQVILAERSESGKSAEAAIRAEGGRATFIQTDVSNADSVAGLLRDVRQAFGPVDVLINNAIYIQQVSVLDMPPEVWERTMAVNLRGTYLTCRAVMPDMLARNQGLIINMTSTDAMPGLSAYIASKAGITAFSQSLALELDGTGVHVVPFGPGMVDTPGIRSVAAGLAPQLGLSESQFLNLSLHADYEGLMPPEHAGAAAAYLAACLAEEYHGQTITGYEVLERAGVLSAGGNQNLDVSPASAQPGETVQVLFGKLLAILDETEAEFGQLPVFVRPMAKAGFKGKAGQSLSDWQRLAASLTRSDGSLPANLAEQLNKLARYYRETPQETARFTKDEATLRMVTETARARLAVIGALLESFK
ncbi:MAG: SDR family NAD(P)-dependent oxidoreductase [Brevefilum sp.]